MFALGAADLDVWLAAYLYPFFRILALFSSAPLLSHQSVPMQLRIGLALLITVLVAPALPVAAAVSPYSLPGVLLVVQQVLVGVAMGFAIQIAFAAAELAGDLIGLQMGLSFASFIDPARNEETPIVGSFLGLLLMLLFFAANGHLLLIGAVGESFRSIPVGINGLHWLAWRELVGAGALVFSAGLQIALPVIAALILANLALGVLTRTAPQLNLFAVGFPVTLLVGMLVLLLALPRLFPVLESVLQQGLRLASP
jgi:flagellar biosynthetic protein FliR